MVGGNGKWGISWEVRFSSPLSFRKARSYSRFCRLQSLPACSSFCFSRTFLCTLATSQIFLQGRLISYPVKYCHFPQHLKYFCKPVFTVSVPKNYSVKNGTSSFLLCNCAYHLLLPEGHQQINTSLESVCTLWSVFLEGRTALKTLGSKSRCHQRWAYLPTSEKSIYSVSSHKVVFAVMSDWHC